MSKLHDLIAEQQKGHETGPRFMIGEQLKEIAEREPLSAELLERDLEIEEMNLEAAEKHFQEYADRNHGKAKAFCITPVVAEKLLREFYGLEARVEVKNNSMQDELREDFVDLSEFF